VIGLFLTSDIVTFLTVSLTLSFENPNFLVPLRNWLSYASIQAKKLENPISHKRAMSLL
jgi:hypothetical protein